MTKKKKLVFIGVILGSILVIFVSAFVVSLPWTIIYLGGVLSKDPPKPEVSYGEFPFKIVYEFDNGERMFFEDILVIDYEGVYWNEATAKHNRWNAYLKSKDRDLICSDNNDCSVAFAADGKRQIRFYLGNCEYYMGLDENQSSLSKKGLVPGDVYDVSTGNIITDDELYNIFGIKIVEKQVPLPITERNTQE